MADAIRSRRPIPDRIANAPTLQPGLALFYLAFQDLSSERQVGQSLGAIPWTAIDQYCTRYEIEGEQYEDMQYHVARLDRAYLEWYAAKREREAAAQKRVAGVARPAPARRKR